MRIVTIYVIPQKLRNFSATSSFDHEQHFYVAVRAQRLDNVVCDALCVHRSFDIPRMDLEQAKR